MPKPRVNFPYWDLAREIEDAEDISIAEAVQRVVESAVEDAVDLALGDMREKGFRAVRSPKMKIKEVREAYQKHHPRETSPEPNPIPQGPTSAASLLDEQLELLNQYKRGGDKP